MSVGDVRLKRFGEPNKSPPIRWQQKEIFWIVVSCLIDESKKLSTDTTAWSELPRGQSYKARQELEEGIKLLEERVAKSIISLREDWATEILAVWILATSS